MLNAFCNQRISAASGSMGFRYVLQLLLCEKIEKLLKLNSNQTQRTNKHRFGILRILENDLWVLNTFENNQILLNKISHRGQCYKTFYGRKLLLFIISQSVCPWQAFPAQCFWVRSITQSGAPERCFTRVGSGLTGSQGQTLQLIM